MQRPTQQNVVPLGIPARRPVPLDRPSLRSASATPPFVPFPRWRKACDRVSAALLGGERRVVVSGPPGTGKTLLLDHVSRVLRAAGWTVMVRLADAGPALVPGHNVALLVDEADRLSRDALQQILAATKGPVVLAGLDSLQTRVSGAMQIGLAALGREEARDYIAQWLALTDRTPAHLEAVAMRRVVELSGGVPRLASTLLGAASWLAESAGDTVITLGHVEEAAALRACFVPGESDAKTITLDDKPPRRGRIVLALAASMLLLGTGAYVVTRYYPAEVAQAWHKVRGMLPPKLQERLGVGAPVVPDDEAPAASPTLAEEPPAETARPTALSLGNLPSEPATPPEPAPLAPPVAASVVTPAQAPAALSSDSPAPAASPAPAKAAAAEPPVVIANVVPAEPPRALPAATIDILLRRGNEMMAIGDVFAARLLFGRAAEAGNAEAMLALGRTFDPAILGQADRFIPADPAEAAKWYRRAANAGNEEAAASLRRVSPTGR